MKKRLLSMILALSMMLTFLPLSVFAGTTNGNYGSGVTWTLTKNNADSNHPTYCLTISSDGKGTGKMTDAYTENGVPWHNVCAQITQVEVTAGVTSIGDHAFYGCSNLATVTLPEGITSIGEEAFRGCEGLTAIRIPSSVQAIGRYAFFECTNLATVENLENSKITKIEEYTFSTQYRYPTRLTSIAFPENLSEIGEHAFYGAGLTKIKFPEKVTSIGSDAFRNCTKLTTVEGFENLKLSTVSNHIFGGCEALSSIKIPDTVTTIENGAFSGCKSLTTIAIPEKVTSIEGNVFNDCENLTSVEGFDKLKISSIESYTFCGCKNLSSITLPNTVKKIDTYAFRQCSALSTITIPENVTSIGFHAFDTCDGLATVVLPQNVPSIGEGAFYGNNENLKIQYPYSKKDWLAQGCTSAKISSLQNDGITILYDSNIIKPIPICYYCSVNFNPNGGTFTDGTTDTKVVSNIYRTENIPEKVQNENKITNPTKSGYTFVGWTLEKDNASTQVDPANISKNITGSRFDGITDDGMTFYALYTVAPKPATVTISGPTDNTVKAGEGSDVFTVAADKGDTDAAKAEFDFAGGKVQYRTGDTEEWLDLTSNELSIGDLTGKQFRVVPDTDAVTAQKTLTVKLMDASGNEIAGAGDSKTFTVTARVHATVEINELNGKTIKQNKPHTFTVTVTAHDDSGNAILTFDNVAGLTYNGTAVTDAGVTVTLTNQPAPLTFTLTPDAEGAGKTLTATLNNGAMDTATYTVSEYEHAKVTIDGLDTDLKQGESKNFTVTVDPKDDRGDATIDFGNKNSEIQYKDGEDWKSMPSDGLKIDLNNGKKPYDFRITPKNDGENQKLTATVKKENTKLGEAEKSYNVSKYVDAVVKIDGLSGTVETDTEKEFTVTVTANDDAGKNVTAKAGFTGPAGATITLKKVQYRFGDSGEWQDGMQELNGMNLDINSLELPFNSLPNITYKLTVTFAEAGNYKFDVSLTKKDAAEAFTSDSAEVTVTKKEEPVTPGGGSTGGSENPGENPGSGSTGGGENPGENPGGNPGSGSTGGGENPGENPGGGSENPGENPGGNPGSGSTTPKRKLEIADGTLTSVMVKDENGNLKDITDTITKDLDGKYEIPVGAKVTITAKDAPEGMKFGEWSISDKTLLSDPDVPYTEKDLIFTMPDNPDGVKLSVVYLEESIGEEPNLVEKGALAGTVVVGSAALLYQGHMLGTELYLRYLLPHGAIIPQNRAELAVLLWQDAENPEPVSTTLYSDISDEDSAIQQAARWAVENDLMEQLDAEEHPDHFDPFVPVTFSDSIRAWKKAQELKKSVH